jgi:glycosyltransferase involved in cell wall biosynthesis
LARAVYSVHSPFAEEIETAWEAGATTHRLPALRRRAGHWLTTRLEGEVYRIADRIQCDSAYTLSLIQDRFPRSVGAKGRVCPGWVDSQRFQPADDRETLRKRLVANWCADGPTFIAVRRLERRMGLANLLDACRILKDRGRSFGLLIGGDGPLRADLERRAHDLKLGDDVLFLGRISEADLPLLYAAADCFVLPTEALECFGLIVLEAYASGIPVIATPVGAIPEVMGEANRNWLSENTTPGAIASAMEAYLAGRLHHNRRALRQRAEKYDRETVCRRLSKLVLPSKGTADRHALAR